MERMEGNIEQILSWLLHMDGAASANPFIHGRRISNAEFGRLVVELLEGVLEGFQIMIHDLLRKGFCGS